MRRPALRERLIALAHRITRLQGSLPTDDVFSPRVVTPGDRARWARAALWTIGIVSLYWVLTFVMTYPQVRVLDRGVSLDIGDPLLSTWRLSWVAHQLPRDPLHLFDANIFYPEQVHAGVLGRHAGAVADRRALRLARRPPVARPQRRCCCPGLRCLVRRCSCWSGR